MKFKTLFALIICNLIWSANPAMGKLVLTGLTPVYAALFRYASALIAAVVLYFVFRRHKTLGPRFARFFPPTRNRKDWFLFVLLGVIAFCLTPLCYMTGLFASRATDGALLTAMEPLFAVLLAWVFIGERISLSHLFSFAAALVGFGMLSGLSLSQLSTGFDSHFTGNLILLLALAGEGAYSVIGRKLVLKFEPFIAYSASLLIGVTFLAVCALMMAGLPDFSAVTWKCIFGAVWTGAVGTTITYLYWMFVLAEAPVATVVLTLFIQPITGSIWGYAFLNERLTGEQALGGALIIVAMLGQTLLEGGYADRLKRLRKRLRWRQRHATETTAEIPNG